MSKINPSQSDRTLAECAERVAELIDDTFRTFGVTPSVTAMSLIIEFELAKYVKQARIDALKERITEQMVQGALDNHVWDWTNEQPCAREVADLLNAALAAPQEQTSEPKR